MIVCPACHAENPDGTKICVKCGTELPKAVPAGAAAKTKGSGPQQEKGFSVKDLGHDLVDALWLLLIIILILVGFLFEATHGTWRFTDMEEAKIIKPEATVQPTPAAKKPATVLTSKPHKISSQPKAPEVKPVEESPAVAVERPPVVTGSAETFFKKGKEQYDRHHYLASFNFLKQSLEVDPTYSRAYFGLGYLYSRFDMDDAAVRMYEMALRFDPSHVDSMNNLAMMYFHAGNYDDALALLQQAAGLQGQNADVQYNLGSLYLEKNQADQALQAFQTAVALRPKDPAIYNNLALTYEKLGKRQEAEDSWQKVLQYGDSADLLQQAKTHLDYLQTQG